MMCINKRCIFQLFNKHRPLGQHINSLFMFCGIIVACSDFLNSLKSSCAIDAAIWCDALNGWENINNMCYKVNHKPMTWTDAR